MMRFRKQHLIAAGITGNVLAASIAPAVVGHSAHPATPYAASLVSVGATTPGAYEDAARQTKRASRSAFRKAFRKEQKRTRKAAAPVAPRAATGIAPPSQQDSSVWDSLAGCEAGGNWSTNTGNGFYGALQETLSNWYNYGGTVYASRPDLASREAQILVGEKIQAAQGWGAWPVCSKILGLR